MHRNRRNHASIQPARWSKQQSAFLFHPCGDKHLQPEVHTHRYENRFLYWLFYAQWSTNTLFRLFQDKQNGHKAQIWVRTPLIILFIYKHRGCSYLEQLAPPPLLACPTQLPNAAASEGQCKVLNVHQWSGDEKRTVSRGLGFPYKHHIE